MKASAFKRNTGLPLSLGPGAIVFEEDCAAGRGRHTQAAKVFACDEFHVRVLTLAGDHQVKRARREAAEDAGEQIRLLCEEVEGGQREDGAGVVALAAFHASPAAAKNGVAPQGARVPLQHHQRMRLGGRKRAQ